MRKKLLLLGVILGMLFSCVSTGAADSTESVNIQSKEKPLIGDVFCDGKIDAKDAVILSQFLAGWRVDIDKKVADCNVDGEVSVKDIVLLAQYLAKWDVTLGCSEHLPSEAVKENEEAGTCKSEGKYDEVIYCSLCCKELSRIEKNDGFGTHTYQNGTCIYCGSGEGDEWGDETDQKILKVRGDLPAGVYTLKYIDKKGVLENYADICSLEITEAGRDARYEGLISENCAPTEAIAIGVFNSSGKKVEELALNSLKPTVLGEKLYSFAAISDTHVGAKTGEDDLKRALAYFEKEKDVKFTTVCGDLTLSGTEENLELYKAIVDNYTSKPVYAISGNHEASREYLAMDSLKAYTGQDLYYSFTYGNDVFIMLGMYDVHDGSEFSEDELRWLYQTLETNRNKRCFVFMHLFPGDGSGDAIDLDVEGDMLDNVRGDVFYSLMSHYENVIYFHGHSHQEFAIQEMNGMNNYDNKYARHSIHIPSLAYPKYASGSSLIANYEGSEGYIVDVYENNIVLRGRDFITGEFLPIATYCLNTATKDVTENTYYDDKQIIVNNNSNILKEGNGWYQGEIDKSEVTKISFADNYAETVYDECWDASISENYAIKAYREGTEVTIVGNENGILANSNSTGLFSGFSNLTEINGLENIKTFNISAFESAFSGCKKLTNIDISCFDLSKVGKFNSLFKDCSDLTSVKLTDNMGENYTGGNLVNFSLMFENCVSLEEADLSLLPSVANRNYYMSGMFKGCFSLKTVKFGSIRVSSMVNMFYNNSALQAVDMRAVDFSVCESMLNAFFDCKSLSVVDFPEAMNTSRVKNLANMFNGCASLILDCSAWDTTNCTNITDFNKKAPGVIAPILNT